MPGRLGEQSEAVLALISGSLDQPAGEAGAGSAPRRRGPVLPGAAGARGPALPGRRPGCSGRLGMLALRLAQTSVDSSSLMTEIFSPLRKKNIAKLGSYI